MAARFVVAVALITLCSANPVLINGVVYRDGRSYSFGQASANGGGANIATANTNGYNAQAYGSSTGGQLSRDGLAYPGQALAQAQTNDYGASKAVAQAQNGYYPVPAPATVITYEQNFANPPEAYYEVPAAVQAHSSAFRNGLSESSLSSATSNGGDAQSSANTGAGPYGATSSNAKTHGYGHADSIANSGAGPYGATSSNAKTHGYGHADSIANSGYGSTRTSAATQGEGSASSSAQTNGVPTVVYTAPVVVPVQEYPTIIAAKTPVYHTAYVPVAPAGIATSNANVVGSGNAAATAKVNHGRTISWRFGTLYDSPAAGSAQAQASTYGHGIAKSHANTNNIGYGSANADADVNAAYGSAKSAANAYNAGSANANANVNSAGYGAARSDAITNNGAATSTANSNAFNHAKATATTHQGYYGSRTFADAASNGHGSALSSAHTTPVRTEFRVGHPQANSLASTSGAGYAHANAQTV